MENEVKSGFRFPRDPITGALVITPELDLKIKKAIRRDARLIALRLYLGSFGLEFRILSFEVRRVLLRMRRALLNMYS